MDDKTNWQAVALTNGERILALQERLATAIKDRDRHARQKSHALTRCKKLEQQLDEHRRGPS